MSWCKNKKSEWKEIIDTISLDLKRNHLMVEKVKWWEHVTIIRVVMC